MWPRVLVMLSTFAIMVPTASGTALYINQSSYPQGIYSVELDGTGFQTVIPGPALPSGTAGRAIAVDELTGTMYYSKINQGMFSAYLDGTHVTNINGTPHISDIETDSAGSRLFFVDDGGLMYSSSLTGEDVTLIGDGAAQGGIAYDPITNSVFFMRYTSISGVRHLQIDQLSLSVGGVSTVADLGEAPGPGASGAISADIEIDAATGRLYWSDRWSERFGSVQRDGTDAHIIYQGIGGFWGPIAVDTEIGKLFFTGTGVLAANLDGSGITVLVEDPSASFMNLALGPAASDFVFPPEPPPASAPEPTTLALFGLGLAGISLVRRRRTRK